MFWMHYRNRGYPQVTAVWGDPRTNSLVIIGPPEADQAIRDTIAEWEGATIGIDMHDDETLETQRERLDRLRRNALEQIAKRRLALIDAAVAGEPQDGKSVTELSRQLEQDATELETVEQKLQVITEAMEQLKSNNF